MTNQDIFNFLKNNLFVKLENPRPSKLKVTLMLINPDTHQAIDIDFDSVYLEIDNAG